MQIDVVKYFFRGQILFNQRLRTFQKLACLTDQKLTDRQKLLLREFLTSIFYFARSISQTSLFEKFVSVFVFNRAISTVGIKLEDFSVFFLSFQPKALVMESVHWIRFVYVWLENFRTLTSLPNLTLHQTLQIIWTVFACGCLVCWDLIIFDFRQRWFILRHWFSWSINLNQVCEFFIVVEVGGCSSCKFICGGGSFCRTLFEVGVFLASMGFRMKSLRVFVCFSFLFCLFHSILSASIKCNF